MFLRKLLLKNFRLFTFKELNFSEGINLITGKNGVGKTSILEAIHYVALTKSFRTSIDKNTIQHSQPYFDIDTNLILNTNVEKNIRFHYSPLEGKQLFFDKNRVSKFSEYIGTIPCVILTPDDLKLTYGSPFERRRFLNVLLSQVSTIYLDNLKNYRKSLQQRNALLSNNNETKVKTQIDIWNRQLIKYGIEIIKKRLEFVAFLNDNLTLHYQNYTNSSDLISSRYRSSIDVQVEQMNLNDIEAEYGKKLNLSFSYDYKQKTTSIGPHREDITFYKNKKSFKEFGSQGENKTLIVVLKFIEWFYLTRNRNINPLLLLDDIFGELDHSRMKGLLKYLSNIGQAFITTTMRDKFESEIIGKTIFLNNGKTSNA